ncbi:hypothetical protein APF79_11630 [bacterium BRH_c32]|nr:MAG: hypothetical protein APF79_11630 [bacterium BRH_c32]
MFVNYKKYIWIFLILAGELLAGGKLSSNSVSGLPAHSYFGWSVSIDGEFAAVSAPRESYDNFISVGAVYIYRWAKGNWNFIQKIIPSDPAMMKLFGASIKLSTNILLVGTPNDNGKSGAAYVYKYDGNEWKEDQKIIPKNPIAHECFGSTVDIRNGIALISSVCSAGTDSSSGSVYVYKITSQNWIEEAVIISSEKNSNDLFGASIAIVAEDQILISAPRGSDLIQNSGVVYSYIKSESSWNINQKIVSLNPRGEGLFGSSISYSENRFIIGAMQEMVDSINSGAAYLYQLDSKREWTPEKRFTPDNERNQDYYGMSVFINKDIIVIGSPKWDRDKLRRNSDIGSANVYSFADNGWTFLGKVVPEDGENDDHFGMAISSYENRLIIGSRMNDNFAVNTGSAYFYTLDKLFPSLQPKFIPTEFQLYQSYPNPFNSFTTIKYDLSTKVNVNITIYDILGRKVLELINQEEEWGRKQVTWNGKNAMGIPVASGIYIYQITTPLFTNAKKMMLIK